MKLLEKRRRRVAINITSLIDVLFLLLIFFMISTTFREQPGMNLILPAASHGKVQQIDQLVVNIGADKKIYVGERLVPPDSLEQAFRQVLPRLKEKKLVLRADESVPHGLVVQVMDAAKGAGLETVIIATRVKKKQP